MKRFVPALALFIAAATVGFFVVVWQLPEYIMSTLMSRVQAQAADGRMTPPLPDDKARSIVLPSPDLAYVLCAYDLSKGALMVNVMPLTLPYWSLAAYAANTDNFFVVNNSQAVQLPGPFKLTSLVLLPPGESLAIKPINTTVVQAPSLRGVVLFRGLMAERNEEWVKQAQASVSCEYVPKR